MTKSPAENIAQTQSSSSISDWCLLHATERVFSRHEILWEYLHPLVRWISTNLNKTKTTTQGGAFTFFFFFRRLCFCCKFRWGLFLATQSAFHVWVSHGVFQRWFFLLLNTILEKRNIYSWFTEVCKRRWGGTLAWYAKMQQKSCYHSNDKC